MQNELVTTGRWWNTTIRDCAWSFGWEGRRVLTNLVSLFIFYATEGCKSKTIGLYFSFCISKGRIHARMSFLLILPLFPITLPSYYWNPWYTSNPSSLSMYFWCSWFTHYFIVNYYFHSVRSICTYLLCIKTTAHLE